MSSNNDLVPPQFQCVEVVGECLRSEIDDEFIRKESDAKSTNPLVPVSLDALSEKRTKSLDSDSLKSQEAAIEEERSHSSKHTSRSVKSGKRHRYAVAPESAIPVSELHIEYDEEKSNLLQVFFSTKGESLIGKCIEMKPMI
jgi:hypothetical protein